MTHGRSRNGRRPRLRLPTAPPKVKVKPDKGKRWQRIVSVVLLVLGFILVPLSAVADLDAQPAHQHRPLRRDRLAAGREQGRPADGRGGRRERPLHRQHREARSRSAAAEAGQAAFRGRRSRSRGAEGYATDVTEEAPRVAAVLRTSGMPPTGAPTTNWSRSSPMIRARRRGRSTSRTARSRSTSPK